MKCCGACLLCCILCSCTNGSATHNVVANIVDSVDVLEKTIAIDCKTPAIDAQIKNIKQQIESIKTVCENDIAVVRADKIKWKVSFFALLFVVLVFVSQKISSKVF